MPVHKSVESRILSHFFGCLFFTLSRIDLAENILRYLFRIYFRIYLLDRGDAINGLDLFPEGILLFKSRVNLCLLREFSISPALYCIVQYLRVLFECVVVANALDLSCFRATYSLILGVSAIIIFW